MIFDLITHDFRLTTNTLLIVFAAFQVLVIGLLADLFVRLSKPRVEIDPSWPAVSEKDFIQVVRMSLSYNPLRVFLPLAVAFGAIGIVKTVIDWSVHDFRLTGNTLLILFAAFQLFGIGLLADLSVRLAQPRAEVDPSSPWVDERDLTGNTYDKYGTVNPIERRLMATFLAQLDDCLPSETPLRILEVGVGEGEVADRVARRFPDAFVTGIDLPDPTLADHWSSKRFAASFADIESLPFRDGSFDLVLAIEVLEHVTDPSAALRELGARRAERRRAVCAARADLAGREHGARQVLGRSREHARPHPALEPVRLRPPRRRAPRRHHGPQPDAVDDGRRADARLVGANA